MELEKQPLHCSSQMEVPHLKRLNWGCYAQRGVSPEERTLLCWKPTRKEEQRLKRIQLFMVENRRLKNANQHLNTMKASTFLF